MATTQNNGEQIRLIECPICDHKAKQQVNSPPRTICPKCGNFYVDSGEGPPQPRRLVRERQERKNIPENEERNKQGGRLQTISNFFQNLGSNKKGKNKTDKPYNSARSQPSSSMSEDSSSELPPITNGQMINQKRSPNFQLSLTSKSRESLSPRSLRSDKATLSPQNRHIYPVRTKNIDQFLDDIKNAKEKDNWKIVQDFYSTTFDSFMEINAVFKRDPGKEYKSTEDPGLKMDFVQIVFDNLLDTPQEIQKATLKATINSLLKDKRNQESGNGMIRPHTKDDLRAYLVLMQNPQFESASTYVIFAHMLRQIAALNDHDHHFLVHWIRRLKSVPVRKLIKRLHSFISIRLFPPRPQDLPPMQKCSWWVPSATKVMALINAANNLSSPLLVPFYEFYNPTLDHLDLMAEYYTWQNPSSCAGFSFCQYPFILSITAKRTILQRDSEQQMIIMARRSLVAKVQRRQLPDVGMLFLNLNIRRAYLVSDSLNEIAEKQHDLKKKLKVTFVGEPGLDMGGLTKEWFLLLLRQIFHSDYGMFTYDKKAGVHWFSSAQCETYQEFNLVGVLMGLAVYNSIILDIRFPACCYKKLLSPAVVPYNNPRAVVGVTPLTVNDLKTVQPEVASGLKDLLLYDGDVEDDFGLTFQVSQSEFGSVKTVELKPGGADISVTKANREEYVQLYVDWVLNRSIYPQFQAFYHGFHSVCASNALIMLRPQEVEMLVCGNPNLDMKELKKVTVYDGYSSNDPAIKNFWDILFSFPLDLQKKFLLFTTGSDRIPIGGMSEMQFKISRVSGSDLLPMAHTCFNQLVLPGYKSKKSLRQKLLTAIENAEGFGLE
ncbi:probable E3 ubiquitin-protein ligase HECTD2 isoform X1 [Mytilus californianus]|uniref:probable E3 ubiquitin-protein ligase HECTD2 isoform X1 n=1 Tax=Mytilus californianus TaxID=6549 RepID=UPI002246319B|nr:probable E3 ubiquitin-protein ligase HECTD2 isoform X1 [Mytilus californianus]